MMMKFCDPGACRSYLLAEDEPACLRQKARYRMWLVARAPNNRVRAAREKMSHDLMEEADAIAKERAIVAL
jgi:hypothetical protein